MRIPQRRYIHKIAKNKKGVKKMSKIVLENEQLEDLRISKGKLQEEKGCAKPYIKIPDVFKQRAKEMGYPFSPGVWERPDRAQMIEERDGSITISIHFPKPVGE